MIEAMRTKFSISYASLAQQMGLSYRTLMRWKKRLYDGQTAVGKRGPKKVNPLNLSELKERIKALDHGRKRSRCTGVLYGSYKSIISRREFNEMIAGYFVANSLVNTPHHRVIITASGFHAPSSA